MAEQSSATIYTIGVYDPADPDKNPKALRRLAQETGVEAFFPSQLNQTVAVCERIARDIRDQYTLGYTAADPKRDSIYHKLKVTAARGDEELSVRTRAGYRTTVVK